jgi:NAD(P)-dependent dehydrogenase (short-subunit alcohol dehydrogenase family)
VPADIREDLAQDVARSVTEAGGRATARRVDIGRAEEMEQALASVLDEHGRLDILVNNAGTDLTVSIEEMPVEEWDRILAVNLRAPFVLSKLAFPIMKKQGRGHIVNIASTAAKRAWANAAAYQASKWGLLGFSHALHVEARPFNVKVTAVVCGGMRTPFLLDRFPDIDVGTLQDPANVADAVRYVLTVPDGTVIPELTVLPLRETSWP